MKVADRIAAVLLLLFGVGVMAEARALPSWTGNSPGPGFLPFWLGLLLVCAAAVMLIGSFARAKPLLHSAGSPESPPESDEGWRPERRDVVRVAIVVGMTAGTAVLSLAIGMVIASGLFMAAALTYLRPGHARANSIMALATPPVIWLLFVRWLGVPLPSGPLGF
jgi:putative tricarboxylic transport membrane protein